MSLKKLTRAQLQKIRLTPTQLSEKSRTPLFALFENIRSLYNVGALFRTSDAALVEKVFLTGTTGTPPHKEIDKSSLGASDVVPWEYHKDPVALVKKLKKQGITIVGLELTTNSTPYYAASYTYPCCLIIGNEVDGISDKLLKLCDVVIDIHMLGRAHSLNVATAYGIAVFEMLRQYKP